MRFPLDAHGAPAPGLRLKMHDALVGQGPGLDDLDGLGSPWNGKKGAKKEVFAADVPTYLARLDPLSKLVLVAMELDKHMEKVRTRPNDMSPTTSRDVPNNITRYS